jgi:hypothetical protein
MTMSMSSAELVATWEDVYREYFGADKERFVDVSRAVATAWRALGTEAALPWWLSAAVLSAAEAFEHQADLWETNGNTRADLCDSCGQPHQ